MPMRWPIGRWRHGEMARQIGKTCRRPARYRAAAEKLRAAYFDAFYNPATGVLAGWRSADGKLHDYYFLWVNGIAIHYGLVPQGKANAIMDRLLAKMKEVGYTRFDLGLPGNLIPVAKKDYVYLISLRWRARRRTTPTDSRFTKMAARPLALLTSRWRPFTIWAGRRKQIGCCSRCWRRSPKEGFKGVAVTA